jgi:hypothetical protein
MRDNEIQRRSSARAAVLKTGAVTAITMAAGAVGVPAASANTVPLCEQVTISGDLTGTRGPFGTCIPNTNDLPVSCTDAHPSLGTLVKVDLLVCTLD